MRGCYLSGPLVRIITILIACWLALPAFAWGGDGHQIVALIAEKGLTPQADAMIHDLLGADVDISDAEVANWADEIRRERKATAPWHYVNIPIDSTGYNPKRDAKNGNNVIDKIGDFEKILADKTKPKAERAEALKFLTHFVGDLHQPLHCGDRNDRGGNSRLVFFLDQQKAVAPHSVWDGAILRNDKGRVPVADYADGLLAKVSKANAEKWAAGTPTDWANESMIISRDVVYKGVAVDGDAPKLDRLYVDNGVVVVRDRLAKAGVRLAMVLNRAASTTK